MQPGVAVSATGPAAPGPDGGGDIGAGGDVGAGDEDAGGNDLRVALFGLLFALLCMCIHITRPNPCRCPMKIRC